MSRLAEKVRDMFKEHPTLLKDVRARHGSGNTIVGCLLSIFEHVPRCCAEAVVDAVVEKIMAEEAD